MDNNEKNIFTNSLGSVSDKRVIIYYKDGSEDIPIKQISSVSFKRKQNIPIAIIYFIVGVGILAGVSIANEVPGFMIVIALLLLLVFILTGIAYYIGNHQIRLSVAGQNRKPIKVELAKTKEGRELFEAIRKNIIEN